MNKFKKTALKLLYPHPLITVVLIVVSIIGLIYVFSNNIEENIVTVPVYVLSFYTLIIAMLRAVPALKSVKNGLHTNKHTSKYLSEADLRARISMQTGTVINISFAVFKLAAGVYYNSPWFIAVGIYYAVLSIIRFILIRRDKKSTKLTDNQLLHQWKSYRLCGCLLLVLNLTMSGMVFQIIYQNKAFSYPGFIIYAIAAYTFYRLTVAIIRLIKNKQSNPVLLSAKALDLSISLMSLFSLQTAMFTSFGTSTDEATRRLMNSITGGTVCLAVVCIAVIMTLKATKKIKDSEKLGG